MSCSKVLQLISITLSLLWKWKMCLWKGYWWTEREKSLYNVDAQSRWIKEVMQKKQKGHQAEKQTKMKQDKYVKAAS